MITVAAFSFFVLVSRSQAKHWKTRVGFSSRTDAEAVAEYS